MAQEAESVMAGDGLAVATVDDDTTAEALPQPVVGSPLQRDVMVHGEVDIASAPRLHERLTAALRDERGAVVVDLRDVTFIDSTGLGVLVNARQRARATGVSFKLKLPEGQARFPFEVTGLVSIFEND
jgi:anti-sigma B factor antagonist